MLNAEKHLLNDIPEPERSSQIAQLKPQALLAVVSSTPPQAWATPAFDQRSAYIACTNDMMLPIEVQRKMIEGVGKPVLVEELPCGHNATFLVELPRTIKIIEGFLERFAKTK
jgi:hypothetical protein